MGTCETQSCSYGPVSMYGRGWCSRYSDLLQAGRFKDQIPVGAKFCAPVQTGPGAHPGVLYNGYQVFPGGKAAGAWH
jgi:hypothetical protein